jgi:hypothetical protein
MIMNSISAKCISCLRSEDVTAMLMAIPFSWDVMRCCWQDVPSILELLYPEDKGITFLLNAWNYSPSDSFTSHSTSISQRVGEKIK